MYGPSDDFSTQQSIGSGSQGNEEGSLLACLLRWVGVGHEVLG